jgi:hypothetical protein
MALREQFVAHSIPQRSSTFQRPKVWQGFLLSHEEKQRIDRMMGTALLDETLCRRLVKDRDTSVMSAFNLSADTQRWLCNISASTLDEMAQAIVLSS